MSESYILLSVLTASSSEYPSSSSHFLARAILELIAFSVMPFPELRNSFSSNDSIIVNTFLSMLALMISQLFSRMFWLAVFFAKLKLAHFPLASRRLTMRFDIFVSPIYRRFRDEKFSSELESVEQLVGYHLFDSCVTDAEL